MFYSIAVDPSVSCRHSRETVDVTCVFIALLLIVVLAVVILVKLWLLLVFFSIGVDRSVGCRHPRS